jgi:hypothetical protein
MKKASHLALIILGVSAVYIGFKVQRTDFVELFSLFSLAFAAYAAILYYRRHLILKYAIGVALLIRFLLIFAFPALSDDVYRFLWDGLLMINGSNPFESLPIDMFTNGLPHFLDENLFDELNSQSYYSVYPPFAQLLFALVASISQQDIYLFNIVLKILFFAGECLSIYLLYACLKLKDLDTTLILYYALNPLIILEVSANLHFEAFLVLFFLASLYFIIKNRVSSASVMLALSVMSKMTSLIFLPFMFAYWKDWRWFKYVSICLIVVVLGFVPLLLGINLQHFTSSLDLYFRKFEFNASVYYVARALGYQIQGYNLIKWIGPVLGIISFLSIMIISWHKEKISLNKVLKGFSWALLVYLLFSTTVHPWYLAMLIALTPFTQHRFALVWSFLIFLSYYAYSFNPVKESTLFLFAEYLGLSAFVILDLYKAGILRRSQGKTKTVRF